MTFFNIPNSERTPPIRGGVLFVRTGVYEQVFAKANSCLEAKAYSVQVYALPDNVDGQGGQSVRFNSWRTT